MTWSTKEFEEQARALAKAHLDEEKPLLDLLVKSAQVNHLNHEQIRRLTRATNVKLFEEKYARLAKAKDRTVDFEPIKDTDVIEATPRTTAHEQASEIKTAEYPDLVYVLTPVNPIINEPSVQTKTAEDVYTPKEDAIDRWVRLKRTQQDLQQKIAECDDVWTACVDTLAAKTKELYWNHDQFEKNALAVLGSDCLVEINAIREACQQPALDISESLAEKIAQYAFGTMDRFTEILQTAVQARTQYIQNKYALENTTKSVSQLLQQLPGQHGQRRR